MIRTTFSPNVVSNQRIKGIPLTAFIDSCNQNGYATVAEIATFLSEIDIETGQLLRLLDEHGVVTFNETTHKFCVACWKARKHNEYHNKVWANCCRRCVGDALRKGNRRLEQYGLDPSRFLAAIVEQGGRCKICRSRPKSGFHIDHCHARENFRGLLCGLCNKGLGFFKDDPTLLREAAHYLESHNEKI